MANNFETSEGTEPDETPVKTQFSKKIYFLIIHYIIKFEYGYVLKYVNETIIFKMTYPLFNQSAFISQKSRRKICCSYRSKAGQTRTPSHINLSYLRLESLSLAICV